jgi:hypothetical protein
MKISLSRIPLRYIGSALWVSKFTFAQGKLHMGRALPEIELQAMSIQSLRPTYNNMQI